MSIWHFNISPELNLISIHMPRFIHISKHSFQTPQILSNFWNNKSNRKIITTPPILLQATNQKTKQINTKTTTPSVELKVPRISQIPLLHFEAFIASDTYIVRPKCSKDPLSLSRSKKGVRSSTTNRFYPNIPPPHF